MGPPRVPRPAWRPEAAVLSVLCHKALLARTKLPEGGAETSRQPRLDEGTASPAPGGGRVREPRVSGATRAVRHGVTPGPCSPDPQRRPQSPGRGSPVGPGPGSRICPVLIEEAGVTVAHPGARPDVRATGGELGAVPRTGCAPHFLCGNPAALGGSVRGRGLREGRGHPGRARATGCVQHVRSTQGWAGRLRRPFQQRGDTLGMQGGPVLCSDPGSEPGTPREHPRGEGDTRPRSPRRPQPGSATSGPTARLGKPIGASPYTAHTRTHASHASLPGAISDTPCGNTSFTNVVI